MFFYQAEDVAQLVHTKSFRSRNPQSLKPDFAFTSASSHVNMRRFLYLLPILIPGVSVTLMPTTTILTIKQLHDNTAELVRSAGVSRYPVSITDHGREIALIANRSLLRPENRKRIVLPEYEAMMAELPGNDIQTVLDEIRR